MRYVGEKPLTWAQFWTAVVIAYLVGTVAGANVVVWIWEAVV